MKWFGEDWGAPICKTAEHVDVPMDENGGFTIRCFSCKRSFKQGSQGVLIPYSGSVHDLADADVVIEPVQIPHLPYHIDCFLEEIGIGQAKANAT